LTDGRTDWYEWTQGIEERVDTFMTQERQQHERIIAGLLAEERRQQMATTTSSTVSGEHAKRVSLPPNDNFVSLCDSLVASEKDYADDLDTLLQVCV
jgi:hypothetical protein